MTSPPPVLRDIPRPVPRVRHCRGPHRTIARKRPPKAAFDYTEGAAEAEISLARARQAFEDIQFNPAILRDVSVVDTSRAVLGGPTALSFGITPMGATGSSCTWGKTATAPRPPAKPAARPSATPKTPPKTAPPKAGPHESPIAS